MKLKPEDYLGKPVACREGRPFEPWGRRGFTVIEVLPELKGRPWDDVALGFIHALRPSHLRLIKGSNQADYQKWRVTVRLEEDGVTIRDIVQEVVIGLPENCRNGAQLASEVRVREFTDA